MRNLRRKLLAVAGGIVLVLPAALGVAPYRTPARLEVDRPPHAVQPPSNAQVGEVPRIPLRFTVEVGRVYRLRHQTLFEVTSPDGATGRLTVDLTCAWRVVNATDGDITPLSCTLESVSVVGPGSSTWSWAGSEPGPHFLAVTEPYG